MNTSLTDCTTNGSNNIPEEVAASDVDRILAEESFIEGNEAQARGDRANAKRYYREALNYTPDDAKIYLKLAEMLITESRTEALQLLARGIKRVRDNRQLQERFYEYCRYRHTRRKKRSKKRREALSVSPVRPERNWKSVLFAVVPIILFAVLLPIYSAQETVVKFKLIGPGYRTAIGCGQTRFVWQASATHTNFLLQIESNGEKLLERYTRDNLYILTQEDMRLLRPERRYIWRVIPVSRQRAVLPHVTAESEFFTSNCEYK